MAKSDAEEGQASAKHHVSHLEEQDHKASEETGHLKLDTHGLPLRPQPSGTYIMNSTLRFQVHPNKISHR